MTDEGKSLHDWLTTGEWRLRSDTVLEIPETVLRSLKSFLAADHADMEELRLYQATLSTLFGSYRQLAHAHKELLSAALLKLGTFSKEQFWPAAIGFLNMSPGLGREAISNWVKVLNLSAEEESELKTELFHAFR
jgi:hypothetical protein